MQDSMSHAGVSSGMQTFVPSLIQRRASLRRIAGSLQRGHTRDLHRLDALLGDPELVASMDDVELKALFLVVKHHRPELALLLLTHVRTVEERRSLGSCLAAIWSRIDINAAWRAISTSSLPKAERLALHSAMV